jgi:hypothetical protein
VINFELPRYSLAVYVIVINTVVLIYVMEYLIATLAYPYSNGYFRKSSRKESSTSFSLEYAQCI